MGPYMKDLERLVGYTALKIKYSKQVSGEDMFEELIEDDEDSEPETDMRSTKCVVNIEAHPTKKRIRCTYCYKKGSKGCMMEAMDGWEENIDGQALVVYKCVTCQSMSLK